MNFVAIVASHIVVRVHTAGPVHALGAAVAGQALVGAESLIRSRERALLEDDIRGAVLLGQVALALAVARLTGRSAGVAAYAMLGLIHRQNRRGFAFIVTLRTELVFLEVLFRHRGGIPAVSRGGCRHRWRHHAQATDGREDR